MCLITQPTTHACGHDRTAAIVQRCAIAREISPTAKCILVPPAAVVPNSQCWNCLRAQIGQSEFRKLIRENLVVPATTVIEGKVEESWMEKHGREREARLRLEAEAKANAESSGVE